MFIGRLSAHRMQNRKQMSLRREVSWVQKIEDDFPSRVGRLSGTVATQLCSWKLVSMMS